MSRAALALLAITVVACDSSGGLILEVTSSTEPLTELSMSVFEASGAVVVDQRVTDGGVALELPLRIGLDGNGRTGQVRVMLWGRDQGADVSFGARDVDLDTDGTVPIHLGALPADCDGDRIPDPEDRCRGVADPEQIDENLDGVGDACQPGKACPGNALVNPDFEAGLAGWDPDSGAQFTQSNPGYTGDSAARLCKNGSGAAESIDLEVPEAVTGLVAGRRFRADAYLRTSTAPPQTADIALREVDGGGTEVGADSEEALPITADWQLWTTTYTTTGDATHLDLQIKSLDTLDGACFDVDAVCLLELAPGCE